MQRRNLSVNPSGRHLHSSSMTWHLFSGLMSVLSVQNLIVNAPVKQEKGELTKPGLVAYASNPSTWEAEARGSL